MSLVVVGVADCRTSNQPECALATYALGSCIAVAIHDPVASVGGLLHFMLPESTIDKAKAQQNPFMFADTGIPLLFENVQALGGEKRRLSVRIAGGAQIMDKDDVFAIGKRNYTAVRKVLWRAGVMIDAEAIGGTVSRTVRLDVNSGKLWLRESGGDEAELRPSRVVARERRPVNGI